MTKQEQTVAEEVSNPPPNESEKDSDEGKPPKHIIRILGSYSLLTFFTAKAQEEFFTITTDPEFEKFFSFDEQYGKDTDSFELDGNEKTFELKMTNHGFVREGFWKEAFPPIFRLTNRKTFAANWNTLLPYSAQNGIAQILSNPNDPEFSETLLYQYSLCKLGEELRKIIAGDDGREENAELKIHIGLNKFGIVNIGITIKIKELENENFEDLCRRIYRKIAHLQEDPLKNMEVDLVKFCKGEREGDCLLRYFPGLELSFFNGIEMIDELIYSFNRKRNSPRLLVSYFQVLAITMIYLFLFEKLGEAGRYLANKYFEDYSDFRAGWKKKIWDFIGGNWAHLNTLLDSPWALSNQIQDSTRKDLPPLRHVVFMYQLVNRFSGKERFLRDNDNKRALLTLGHNVGWLPSCNPPFPLFEDNSDQVLPKDSSLLENSCCLIFPQGLVIVIPPDQYICIGGDPVNNSSTVVPYLDYWKLIFKLFIRVVEVRLLIGMTNRYLSDAHIDFIESCNYVFFKKYLAREKTYNQLTHIGWLMQRISGKVIGPEITRFSFVRKKITSFMEGVNFEDHMAYVQSELQQLNGWLNQDIIKFATVGALIVSGIGIIISLTLGINNVLKEDQKELPKVSVVIERLELTGNSMSILGSINKSVSAILNEMEEQEKAIKAVKFRFKELEGILKGLTGTLDSLKYPLSVSPQDTSLEKEGDSEERTGKDPSESAPLQK
ncbi:MAG: hypothetical protein KC584_15240 [Nitrospira sp.]|nr:hypothetical protein [Nitrospira sp.]